MSAKCKDTIRKKHLLPPTFPADFNSENLNDFFLYQKMSKNTRGSFIIHKLKSE